LISNGASPNVTTPLGFTPLHEAAWGAFTEIAQLLIDHGASTDPVAFEGYTPLSLAAQSAMNSGLEMCKLLVSAGANINVTNLRKQTLLHVASRSSAAPTIEYLVSLGPQLVNVPDRFGDTPLHIAALRKHPTEIINTLIRAGADRRAVNDEGKTAYDLAVAISSAEMSWIPLLVVSEARPGSAVYPYVNRYDSFDLIDGVSRP